MIRSVSGKLTRHLGTSGDPAATSRIVIAKLLANRRVGTCGENQRPKPNLPEYLGDSERLENIPASRTPSIWKMRRSRGGIPRPNKKGDNHPVKITKRVLALILGGVIGFVQIQQIPKLLGPFGASMIAFGYYVAWLAFTAMAIYLVGYGVGFFPRPKKN